MQERRGIELISATVTDHRAVAVAIGEAGLAALVTVVDGRGGTGCRIAMINGRTVGWECPCPDGTEIAVERQQKWVCNGDAGSTHNFIEIIRVRVAVRKLDITAAVGQFGGTLL